MSKARYLTPSFALSLTYYMHLERLGIEDGKAETVDGNYGIWKVKGQGRGLSMEKAPKQDPNHMLLKTD